MYSPLAQGSKLRKFYSILLLKNILEKFSFN